MIGYIWRSQQQQQQQYSPTKYFFFSCWLFWVSHLMISFWLPVTIIHFILFHSTYPSLWFSFVFFASFSLLIDPEKHKQKYSVKTLSILMIRMAHTHPNSMMMIFFLVTFFLPEKQTNKQHCLICLIFSISIYIHHHHNHHHQLFYFPGQVYLVCCCCFWLSNLAIQLSISVTISTFIELSSFFCLLRYFFCFDLIFWLIDFDL